MIGDRKIIVYVCREGENAIENLTGDGLLIIGCGYGDPGRSGMVEAFGDIGDAFLYRLGNDMPYRFAYYYCEGDPREGLECLLSQGCRSIVVDFGIYTNNVRSDRLACLSRAESVIVVNSDRMGTRYNSQAGNRSRPK